MKNRLRAFALVATVVLGATAAHAQQTSESPTPPSAAADRSAAATQDVAPDRTFVDTARDWLKESQILERIEGDVDGWYPRIGGITRGSGFALGPGYRLHVLDNHVRLDVSAGLSVRLYKAFDVRARWLQAWHERAEVWTDYRFEDFPQEDFYGTGPDTTEDRRTSYGFRSSDIVVRGQVKPMPWLRAGVSLGYLNPTIGPGRDREFPSIEQLFTDISVPGLTSQPNFLHSQVFAEIDYRDAGGNPKNGGFYRGAYGSWNDRTFNLYDFRRFDGNAAQYLPLTRDRKHVISGKVGVSFVNNAPGNRVPFYFLPYVGGQDTVRSYPEFRFKDENALWFGGEYRWIPITWVSAVVFADFGKVAHDWQDINGSDLKHGYGFGVRFHSSRQTFAKVDFGFGGGEGWQAFLKLGPF
jgi:hypothetical protein